MMNQYQILVLLLLFSLLIGLQAATEPEYTITNRHRVIQEASVQMSRVPIGTKLEDIAFTTLDGEKYHLDALVKQAPVVFVFLATECPVAQRYTMRLNRLQAEFAGESSAVHDAHKPVTFVAVYPNFNESVEDIKAYVAKAGFLFPIVKDTAGQLAHDFGANITPQAMVVDTAGTLRYRGAIDDNRYETRVRHHYLKDTLYAILSGRAVPEEQTSAFGCTVHLPDPRVSEDATYSEHIAPILQKQCQSCHRDGEVAPFSLVDYSDAKAWATEIAEYTRARLMPPWKPAPGYGSFKNERRLTDTEIETISRWVEMGTPAGNLGNVPSAPNFPEGWALGQPDWIVEMPVEYEIEPEGEDEYRHFIIPTNFEQDMYVRAVDVQPGNRKTVHHVIAYLDVSGEARKLDAQDEKPGYVTEGTSPGFDDAGTVGGWAPGVTPAVLPEGVGYLLPKGADIVMQVHYYRTGHLERDRSRLGLYFSKTPRTTKLHITSAINSEFEIPAGANWHEVLASRKFKTDVYLLAAMPHMHLLGRDMHLVATTPKGKSIDLIWIQDWDFNWQDIYHYREPLFLPAGTQVNLVAHFDNSAENPANPHSPPVPVGWGEKTTDEMCIGFLYYVKANEFTPEQPSE